LTAGSPISDKHLYRPLYSPWLGEGDVKRYYNIAAPKTLVSQVRCYVLYSLLMQAIHVEGEIWECGVYKGGTAAMMANILKDHCSWKRLFLFDTFEGMPDTNPGHDLHKKGDFSDTSLDAVADYIKQPQLCVFRKGFIPETFMGLESLKIAFAHIDVATDITYIPMAKGFVYLVAILELYSRKVLAWRVSNAMTTDFCVDALQEALTRYGTPEIFNTDQGSQFTAEEFTQCLLAKGVRVSMDGKGRWVDNVFVERLWRSVKYEEIYLHAHETPRDVKTALERYFRFYNERRPHQSLQDRTPDEMYFGTDKLKKAA